MGSEVVGATDGRGAERSRHGPGRGRVREWAGRGRTAGLHPWGRWLTGNIRQVSKVPLVIR